MKRKKKTRNSIKYSKLFIFSSLFLFVVMIGRVIELSTSKTIDGVKVLVKAIKTTAKN